MCTEDVKKTDVQKLHEKAVDLLNHLELILSEEEFEKIDVKMWNDVSMFLVNNPQ